MLDFLKWLHQSPLNYIGTAIFMFFSAFCIKFLFMGSRDGKSQEKKEQKTSTLHDVNKI
jgi:hypothetical protein